MSDHNIKDDWSQLFERDYIKSRINEIAEKYPDVSSLEISLRELEAFDLFDPLSESPEEVLVLGKEVLVQCIDDSPLPDIPEIDAEQLSIRPTEGSVKLPIGAIRNRHRGKLVEFVGIVRRCTGLKAIIIKAAYHCRRCGHIFYVSQNIFERIKTPSSCSNPNCDRGGPFDLLKDKSKFIDIQRLTIQEPFDEIGDGRREPKSLDIVIRGDSIDKVRPGDRVKAVGIIQFISRSEKAQLTEYEPYLDGLYLEAQGSDYFDIEITQEDERSIIEKARDADILEKLTQSVAPSILGYSIVKLGLLMQQVSGCTRISPDGMQSRGEIHILLIGDPSVGKSILLSFISKLAPRFAMSAGGGASGVGITASVLKDEQYGWVVEAGVLPLANGGTAIVDEFDKLGEDDKGMLHEALEQGEIHIDKASIHAVLPTKCSLLAAANPKLGRFDAYEPIAPQINLTPTLLSRFDLIFVMKDESDVTKDEQIAKHILSGTTDEETPIKIDLLRRYLAYARRLQPEMSSECEERLRTYYTAARKNNPGRDCVPILPRSLHSLRRLAEASAKLRLSEIAIKEDADLAIRVYQAAFGPLISTEDGRWDADLIDLGVSGLDRDRTKLLIQVIRGLSLKGEATLSNILKKADDLSIPPKDSMKIISRLKKDGDIMEPSPGIFRPIQ